MDKATKMLNHLHHVHVFASNLLESVRFYKENFGGCVILDAEVAGARNVFMRIGTGRLHLYDQPPKQSGRGSIHHFGIQTSDLDVMIERLKSNGVTLRKDPTDFGYWRYIMVPAPDDILIELFEIDQATIPPEYLDYFE